MVSPAILHRSPSTARAFYLQALCDLSNSSRPRMSLLGLPNELLLSIAESLDQQGLYSLIQINHHLNILLTPVLLRVAEACKHKHWSRPCGLDESYCTLHWAVYNGHIQLVKFLLDRDFDTHCEEDFRSNMCRETLLHFAALKGHLTIVRMLLNKGAYVDTPAYMMPSRTALHYAVLGGHEKVVSLLLRRGANVNAKAWADSTALSMVGSVQYDTNRQWNARIFRMLLEHGADVNATESDTGTTALHWAVFNGNTKMIDMLLQSGARTDIRCKNGGTVFQWAWSWNGPMVKWFQEKGLIPLLKGKYFDKRKEKSSREYWYLMSGTGRKNRLKSFCKALVKGIPGSDLPATDGVNFNDHENWQYSAP